MQCRKNDEYDGEEKGIIISFLRREHEAYYEKFELTIANKDENMNDVKLGFDFDEQLRMYNKSFISSN